MLLYQQDGAACAGLGIAAIALAAAEITGNPMWDPIGSILVGNLLGVVRTEGPLVAVQ